MNTRRIVWAGLLACGLCVGRVCVDAAAAGEPDVGAQIAQWIGVILDPKAEPARKSDAVRSLGAAGEPAVDPVLDAVRKSTDEMPQMLLLTALAEVKDRSAVGRRQVEELTKLLTTKSFLVRYWVVKNLATAGDDRAKEPLIASLETKDPFILRVALKALVDKNVRSAAPRIVPLLKERADQMRIEAAMALKALGDEKQVEDLMRLLSDPEITVRRAAADAIETITKTSFGMTENDTDEQIEQKIADWTKTWREKHPAAPK
jgi:HEAT repeat protein